MVSAILYMRVSTDEQAEKGYSIETQKDVLRQYCISHNIIVQNLNKDDFSAKTFNRPGWKTLMQEIKTVNSRPNLILFTKWDRFSRNVGEAYAVIKTLQDLKVEPRAIDQYFDLSIPENKILLAIYLAGPEAENDRRGLNVRAGMKKAKERGRWMGHTPIGYCDIYTKDGEKLMLSHEPEASLIKKAFEELVSNQLSVAEAYRKAKKSGLKCTRGHFYDLLKNPVYAGYIRAITEPGAPPLLIPGQHDGIITLDIFKLAQKKSKKAPHHQYISIH